MYHILMMMKIEPVHLGLSREPLNQIHLNLNTEDDYLLIEQDRFTNN